MNMQGHYYGTKFMLGIGVKPGLWTGSWTGLWTGIIIDSILDWNNTADLQSSWQTSKAT